MIVYGDPSSQRTFRSLIERLKESVSPADALTLDDARRLLIHAGMLEQALEDAGTPEPADLARRLTNLAASAFLAARKTPGGGAEDARTLDRLLNGLSFGPDRPLDAKLPEGFAFYGLYPEQYADAAELWARRYGPKGAVVVVGVRSIGTALSAVVAAALRERGVGVRRRTVRPTGHPFARETDLDDEFGGAQWVLVVDEGPGLSGSSMASVAEALARRDFPRERIVFFPGHGGEPGPHAAERVKVWWRETPRVVVPTESLRWNGLSVEGTLAAHTGGGARIEELSGGRWRELAYADPVEWPAVAKAFERRKLRATRPDGSAVLWKFVGFTVPGTILGFAAAPWIEGTPLRREDAAPNLIAAIGRHLLDVAGPPLAAEEATAAQERLAETMRANAKEAGIVAPLPAPPALESGPSAGDYRLAPWEWRRLPDGQIVKAGRIAPTLDHTIVGRQPLAWDVAGAMVEWDLDHPGGLPPVSAEALRFYRAAYAAFRMGQCAMFAEPDEEGRRLARDAAFYRAGLERAIES